MEPARLKVSASLVSYNSAEEIEACLASLFSHTKGCELTVFVSDNGSADDTVARVRASFPQVTVLENKANLGFGGGHNRVLPLLQSEYHVFVNPDILLTEDSLTKMAAYLAEHPEAGQLMPDVRNSDGSRQLLPKNNPTPLDLLARRLPFMKKRAARYCRAGEAMETPTSICFASGCFTMLPTALLKSLKGFDERYFLYMEDADLSRRVAQDHQVVFYPYTRVTHAWHRASGHSLRGLKLHLQSAVKYFRKWGVKGR